MIAKKHPLFLTALALVSAATSAAQGTVTTQPTPTPTPTSYPWSYSFPPVGLAYPETLQVNVANQPAAAFLGISPVGVCTLCSTFGIPSTPLGGTTVPVTVTPITNGPCAGTITFTNAAGTTIGTPVSFTVAVGQIFSAPLPFSMTGYSGFRGEILPSVQGTTTIPSSTVCSLSVSLETFDTNTGVTHVFLPAPGTYPMEVLSGNFSAIGVPSATSVLK
jgi:hypothetical protein